MTSNSFSNSSKTHAASLCALALLFASAASPLLAQPTPHVNLHASMAAANSRLTVTVQNNAFDFRDVRIADHVYTVLPKHSLIVQAPAGTPIYAASNMSQHHPKGSVLAQVEPGEKKISLN